MTDLTHLNLECRMSVDGKSDPLVEALRSLCGLRELTLTRCKEMRRLIVPADAELTKLVVDSSALEVSGLHNPLFLTSLLMCPLTLSCPFHMQHWQDQP